MVLTFGLWGPKCLSVMILKLLGYNTCGLTTTVMMQLQLCHNDLHVVMHASEARDA